jgi:hypothetical protein
MHAMSTHLRASALALFLFAACTGTTGNAGDPAASDESSIENARRHRHPDAGHSDSGVLPPDSGSADDSGTVAGDTGAAPDATIVPDAGATSSDAGTSSDDGTPTRQQCTGNFGSGLSATFGRMDGFLVSVLPPGGSRTCNGDARHVHLQVMIQGSVYDVAVNTDTLEATRDLQLPGGPWSEGWNTSIGFDYTQVGLHSSDFTTPSDAAGAIESFVATANHVTIFATGYGPTGAHDVHRHPATGDGAIIIDPLSSTPHGLFFRFSTDSF